MFFKAIAVFGLVSLLRLPMDLLPEISYPTLTVRSAWAGAAPEDVVAFDVGKGSVVALGSQVDFRTQTPATFKLLFNALVLGN